MNWQDLVTRIRQGLAFANNDRGNEVFYGPYSVPEENYNDWPSAFPDPSPAAQA